MTFKKKNFATKISISIIFGAKQRNNKRQIATNSSTTSFATKNGDSVIKRNIILH